MNEEGLALGIGGIVGLLAGAVLVGNTMDNGIPSSMYHLQDGERNTIVTEDKVGKKRVYLEMSEEPGRYVPMESIRDSSIDDVSSSYESLRKSILGKYDSLNLEQDSSLEGGENE